MTDIIVVGIVVILVALASLYIYKAKKAGAKCIGCGVKNCQSKGCGCGCEGDNKDGCQCK